MRRTVRMALFLYRDRPKKGPEPSKGAVMLLEKVRCFIRKKNLLSRGDRVVCALSGGSDSVGLLFVLLQLREEYQLALSALHIHHGLRGEAADRDAAFCRTLCAPHGIPVRIVRKDVRREALERGLSLEEAGREARRAEFFRILADGEADKIALAHQKNDVAETLLHNLARGTGLSGAASVRAERGGLIRPLLCVTREEIAAYLSDNGIAWVEDETNADLSYTRNRIRMSVLPELVRSVNARSVEHLAEFSGRVGEALGFLERETDAAWKRCARKEELLTEPFLREHPYLQGELIRRAYGCAAGSLQDFSSVHAEQVRELFSGCEEKRISLPGGVEACRTAGGVAMVRTGGAEPGGEASCAAGDAEYVLPVPGEIRVRGYCVRTSFEEPANVPDFRADAQKTWCKRIDYDKIKTLLLLRGRKPGDYLTVTAEGGRKTLSDYLTDHKVPRRERDGWLVLADGCEIAALPDGRLGERYKVTHATRRILRIEITPDPRQSNREEASL